MISIADWMNVLNVWSTHHKSCAWVDKPSGSYPLPLPHLLLQRSHLATVVGRGPLRVLHPLVQVDPVVPVYTLAAVVVGVVFKLNNSI